MHSKYIHSLIHKSLCIVFAVVFVNFSIQFNNYVVSKIISISVADDYNGIDIDFVSCAENEEEHSEETRNGHQKNKTEYLYISNMQHCVASFNSAKNHFVMAGIDEVSIEIPSPPPWA